MAGKLPECVQLAVVRGGSRPQRTTGGLCTRCGCPRGRGLMGTGGSLSPQADVSIPVVYCGWAGAHQSLPDVRGRGLGGPAPLAVSERQVGAVRKGRGQHARYAPAWEAWALFSSETGRPLVDSGGTPPPSLCTRHLGFNSPSHPTPSPLSFLFYLTLACLLLCPLPTPPLALPCPILPPHPS